MSEDRVRPFHCGSQFAEWEAANCSNCKLSTAGFKRYRCKLQKAIDKAYWDDGTVSKEVADAIGATKYDGYYIWECPARQPDDQPRERKPAKTREHKGQMRLI